MKKALLLVSALILCAAFAAPSFASDCNKKKHSFNGHFGDMDLDGNDQVSWEEFKKHFAHSKENTFKGIDENKDGAIDHDEWHTFKAHHGYGHKHKE